MIIKENAMKVEEQAHVQKGDGTVIFKSLMENGSVKHSRLFSEVTLKKGCSIGYHEHIKETEYYWIMSGTGIVEEKSGEKIVSQGDLVVTGNGESHSIRNEKDEDLVFMALIILD